MLSLLEATAVVSESANVSSSIDNIGELTDGEIDASQFKAAGTQYDLPRILTRSIVTQASLIPKKPKRYTKVVYHFMSCYVIFMTCYNYDNVMKTVNMFS